MIDEEEDCGDEEDVEAEEENDDGEKEADEEEEEEEEEGAMTTVLRFLGESSGEWVTGCESEDDLGDSGGGDDVDDRENGLTNMLFRLLIRGDDVGDSAEAGEALPLPLPLVAWASSLPPAGGGVDGLPRSDTDDENRAVRPAWPASSAVSPELCSGLPPMTERR